ncbi:MAG TPA: glutaredoxin family protein [Woeseiaceae bacterium]|nr:glutaredoxin family protein [Woeseiaceae bacterium]
MQVIDVYSRRGCHLCEILLEQLIELTGTKAKILVHDVDTRDDWRERYGDLVPLVACQGRVLCHYKLDTEAVTTALAGTE